MPHSRYLVSFTVTPIASERAPNNNSTRALPWTHAQEHGGKNSDPPTTKVYPFRVEAIRSLTTLKIRGGVCFFGENGSGKSTREITYDDCPAVQGTRHLVSHQGSFRKGLFAHELDEAAAQNHHATAL